MPLHGINDNILVPNLSYLGVYQYEAKNERSTKIYIYFWVETKQNNLTKGPCTFLRLHW